MSMTSLQSWVSENKLTSVATLWASAVGVSLVVSATRRPSLKPSLKLIHARMHAQAMTLGVLSSAAALHYLEAHQALADGGSEAVCSSVESTGSVVDWY